MFLYIVMKLHSFNLKFIKDVKIKIGMGISLYDLITLMIFDFGGKK